MSGMTTKVFAKLDNRIRGTYSENQLWWYIDNTFFSALEQKMITWESWELID